MSIFSIKDCKIFHQLSLRSKILPWTSCSPFKFVSTCTISKTTRSDFSDGKGIFQLMKRVCQIFSGLLKVQEKNFAEFFLFFFIFAFTCSRYIMSFNYNLRHILRVLQNLSVLRVEDEFKSFALPIETPFHPWLTCWEIWQWFWCLQLLLLWRKNAKCGEDVDCHIYKIEYPTIMRIRQVKNTLEIKTQHGIWNITG